MQKLEKPYTAKQRADFIVLHNHQNGRAIEETEKALFALEAWEKLVDDEVVDNTEEYEAERAQKEAERISMLNLTAADVERAIYKAKGIDFDDVIDLVEAQALSEETPAIDIKALKIELKANNFYRGNPYIDVVGTLLGFTKEQLDEFFETNDYRYLTTCTLTINPTPENAKVILNGLEQKTAIVPYSSDIDYMVTAEGYKGESGTVIVEKDEVLDVELVEEVENA